MLTCAQRVYAVEPLTVCVTLGSTLSLLTHWGIAVSAAPHAGWRAGSEMAGLGTTRGAASRSPRTPVSDSIRSQMWGLDGDHLGGGHRMAWGELYALSTGDGPQMRPSAGGRYISLIDRPPPPPPLSTLGRWRHDPGELSRRLFAPAPTIQPSARAIGAMDRSRHATTLLRRGLIVAASEAAEAARQLDRTVYIAAPEGPVGPWNGVDPRI